MIGISTGWNRPCRSLAGAATRVLALHLRPATAERPRPIHALVLLDVSTSMAGGGKMAGANQAITAVWRELQPGDRMALVVFSSRVRTLLGWVTKGDADDHLVADALISLEVGGTTCLETGLDQAFAMLADCPADEARFLWLVTDGQPTDPNGRPREDVAPILDATRRAVVGGVTLCALGLGDAADYNAPFLRDLADSGRGLFCYAPDPASLTARLQGLLVRARAEGITQARLHLALSPGTTVKAIARIMPEYLPMDLPAATEGIEVVIGTVTRPETVILVEIVHAALFGTRAGPQTLGSVRISGRDGGQEVATEAVPLVLTFVPPDDPRLHAVDAACDELRVAMEIARNAEMRARSHSAAEKLLITSQLVDLSRRTGNLELIAAYEGELVQLSDEGSLSPDQEAAAVEQARVTGRLLQPFD